MLLVLKPLPFVFFSVGKQIDTVTFTFSLYIFSFIDITVLKTVFPFPFGLRPFISPV